MAVNKVILIGNVGADPTTRLINENLAGASFSLATTDRYSTRDGQKHENTTWHKIEVLGILTDFVAKYIKKGMTIYVEGKLKTDTWQNSDGYHSKTSVLAQSIQIIGLRKRDGQDADGEEAAGDLPE